MAEDLKEYVSKDARITPSSEGATAWTNAGRRIAPAYNEAAHFLEKSGVAAEQLAHNAEQTAKLQDALNEQYKLLADVYEQHARASSSGRSGGGVPRGGVVGGGGSSPRPAAEISHAASDLSSYAAMNPEQHDPAKGFNKGGYEINLAGGESSPNSPSLWSNDARGGTDHLIGVGGSTSGDVSGAHPGFDEYGNAIVQPNMKPTPPQSAIDAANAQFTTTYDSNGVPTTVYNNPTAVWDDVNGGWVQPPPGYFGSSVKALKDGFNGVVNAITSANVPSPTDAPIPTLTSLPPTNADNQDFSGGDTVSNSAPLAMGSSGVTLKGSN